MLFIAVNSPNLAHQHWLEANHNNDKVVDIPTTANNPASPAVMAGFELGETKEIE